MLIDLVKETSETYDNPCGDLIRWALARTTAFQIDSLMELWRYFVRKGEDVFADHLIDMDGFVNDKRGNHPEEFARMAHSYFNDNPNIWWTEHSGRYCAPDNPQETPERVRTSGTLCVRLPSDSHWSVEIDGTAQRIKCCVLNYFLHFDESVAYVLQFLIGEDTGPDDWFSDRGYAFSYGGVVEPLTEDDRYGSMAAIGDGTAIQYFALQPALAVLTDDPQRGGQLPREEQRNARGTKVLRKARSRVRMVVIDGVKRLVSPKGAVTYTVHARGWHTRRHEVREHLRHLSSGKVVAVRAHQRGDERLGWVSHAATRFRVAPDKVFYLDASKKEAN